MIVIDDINFKGTRIPFVELKLNYAESYFQEKLKAIIKIPECINIDKFKEQLDHKIKHDYRFIIMTLGYLNYGHKLYEEYGLDVFLLNSPVIGRVIDYEINSFNVTINYEWCITLNCYGNVTDYLIKATKEQPNKFNLCPFFDEKNNFICFSFDLFLK